MGNIIPETEIGSPISEVIELDARKAAELNQRVEPERPRAIQRQHIMSTTGTKLIPVIKRRAGRVDRDIANRERNHVVA